MTDTTAALLDTAAMASALKRRLGGLPYTTTALPGIGGAIKAEPSHFEVEEKLPYAPCGEGEHVFVTLRRSGWNTADVARDLARLFKVSMADIGWGGRKDRQAVATQTFSVRLALNLSLSRVTSDLASLPFEILNIDRHRNKLKTGHVAGNRFRIILSGTGPQALDHAWAIARLLACRGVPNYFGEQRFGLGMANLERAARLLNHRRPPRGKDSLFLVSALQAALFNCWLGARIADGYYACMLAGDVAQKTDTGGLFIVEDEQEANARFDKGEIIYTGPMFGHKMKTATHDAGCREDALLDLFALKADMFKPLRAPGTRRPGLVRPRNLDIRAVQQGLEFSFGLPSGVYATTVLREFMRPPSVAGDAGPPLDQPPRDLTRIDS